MQKKDTNSLLKPIGKIFKKFHLLIFFVFTIGCLSLAVVTTSAVITGGDKNSSLTPNPGASTSSSIDHATLQRIQDLKPSTEPSAYTPTQGMRSNPFSE